MNPVNAVNAVNPANPANTATVRPPYADVVDLDRYPIHDLGSPPGRTLLARCRAELEADGVCSLPGFVRDDAVAEMIELAQELADVAWASQSRHTVYFDPPDATVPDDDPRARLVRSAKHGLAYDQLPAEAPIRRLYENDDLTHFIAAVLGKDIFYRSADPLDAVQVTTMSEGEELGWHFDRSEFSVTVMYQQAEQGGDFDYCPGCAARPTRTTPTSGPHWTTTRRGGCAWRARPAPWRSSAGTTRCTG